MQPAKSARCKHGSLEPRSLLYIVVKTPIRAAVTTGELGPVGIALGFSVCFLCFSLATTSSFVLLLCCFLFSLSAVASLIVRTSTIDRLKHPSPK